MTPRRLSILAMTLAGASVVSFILGVVLLTAGIASKGGGGGPHLFRSSAGPVKASFGHGAPVGLYLMTRAWYGGGLEKAAYYFTDDGHVYVNPEDGFTNEQLSQRAQQQGTIAMDGDKMTVNWTKGNPETSPIERDSTGFMWDMGSFVPVKGFESDRALVGKWEGGNSITTSGGYARSAQELELHDDGSFTGASAGAVGAAGDRSAVSGGSSSSSAGHWKLDGYVLTLSYDNGKELRGIAFPFDERFYFRGVLYKKLAS